MWIVHPYFGFFSIVEADRRTVKVRARVRADLDRLREVVPKFGPTISTPSATTRPTSRTASRRRERQ